MAHGIGSRREPTSGKAVFHHNTRGQAEADFVIGRFTGACFIKAWFAVGLFIKIWFVAASRALSRPVGASSQTAILAVC